MFIINGYDRKVDACSPWTSCLVSNDSLMCFLVYVELMIENQE